MRLKGLFALFLICLGTIVHSGQSYFYVMKVYSGDRIRVIDICGKQFDVRLCGVDAPEANQPFGKESIKWLQDKVQKKKFVHLEDVKFFKDESAEATVILHSRLSEDTENINQSMVAAGMAWDVSTDDRYANEQRDAKKEHIGLWGHFPQIRPSEWRKNHPCEFAGISPEEPKKLIPSQSDWVKFLERALTRDSKEAALMELPHWEFKELRGDLSIKSLFGVELGARIKDLPFPIERLGHGEAILTGNWDSYAFIPKKMFRSFEEYRIRESYSMVSAIRAEIVVKQGAQFGEDVMTLKKILERKFGIVLKKVPDVDWYVFTGSGKDYSMLRLGSPMPHVLMIELKIDGKRLNEERDDELRRKNEAERNIKKRDIEIKARDAERKAKEAEKKAFDGIDAL